MRRFALYGADWMGFWNRIFDLGLFLKAQAIRWMTHREVRAIIVTHDFVFETSVGLRKY